MDFFTRLFTMSIIPIGVSLIMWLAMRESEREEKSNYEKQTVVVRAPKIFIGVAVAGILVFGGFIFWMTFFPNGTESLSTYIVFSAFVLLGVWLFYYLLIWKVWVTKDEDYFLLRDGFGRKYKIFYADCINIEERKQGYIVHTKVKKVEISGLELNYEFLIAELQKHHVKLERNLRKKKKA